MIPVRNDQESDRRCDERQTGDVFRQRDLSRPDVLPFEQLGNVRQRGEAEPEAAPFFLGDSLTLLDSIPSGPWLWQRIGSNRSHVAVDVEQPLQSGQLAAQCHASAQSLAHVLLRREFRVMTEQRDERIIGVMRLVRDQGPQVPPEQVGKARQLDAGDCAVAEFDLGDGGA